jgi:proton-dependent oligopeptide transporter, POT family
MSDASTDAPKGPWWKEVTQPFVDLVHAPRALWGINLTYFLEGLVYFGMLGYLAMFFNEAVGLDDVWAGLNVGVLTFGITFSMFFFGGLSDKWGVRVSILGALALMFLGRIFIAAGPSLGLAPAGLGSPIHLMVLFGILLIVLGYGMYQPAAYAAVRQFSTPEAAGMGYAMLYALMNLGGWIPTFAFLLRDKEYAGLGISGVYWVYTGLTVVGLIATFFILTRKVEQDAIAKARAAADKVASDKADAATKANGGQPVPPVAPVPAGRVPVGFWEKAVHWLRNHPLADPKFSFFVFCLIPVQTLFAHNWLTLPMYVERAYAGTWIGQNFEVATNFNPILIFILVPIVTALTQHKKVYNMMIAGTAVMAAPTFLLATGPSPLTLFFFLVLMTIGEAMWQPRFLQYAAEIAPEGRTGAYMGVAQFPWFLTKVIVPIYSGWFLTTYCPKDTPPQLLNTETMWFIYGVIAMSSTVMLILARNWLGKNFKTKA